MDQPEGTRRRPPAWRLRDRLFIVLTANLAVACVWATEYVAHEKVLRINSARIALMLFMPQLGTPLPPATQGGRFSAAGADDAAGSDPMKSFDRVKRQIGAVEAIVHIWRRVMWGVAGFLELAALAAAVTRRSRLMHLLAAGVIFLSTAATLIGIRLLIAPDYGGMEPQPLRFHVYVAAVQSAYGVALLIAFARKPRVAAG